MNRSATRKLGKALFFSAGILAAPLGLCAPADDVKALLEIGKVQEAYELGRKMPDQLGTPQFDFYFGVAAVNAGRSSEGVLALERFLLNFPDNEAARLELARGYYLAGETGRAREEFEAMLARKPAPGVARVIVEYLDAIKERESRYQSSVTWYAETGGGHDSNVQSGVNSPDITLPVFGDITLADNAVRRSDRFTLVGIGGRFTLPVRRNIQLFGMVAGESRQNREFDAFDQEFFSAGGGIGLIRDKSAARLSITQSTQTIDHQKYRDTGTVTAEFGHQWTQTTAASLGVQLAQFRYAGSNAVRDADYNALTLGMRQRLTGAWRPDYDFSLFYGREEARLEDRQDLSRHLWGGRAGASIAPSSSWAFSAGVSVLRSDYRAPDPLLLVTREDRFTSYDLSATYMLTHDWAMRAEYSRARNKSSLPLYEYKRNLGALKLRYDFK